MHSYFKHTCYLLVILCYLHVATAKGQCKIPRPSVFCISSRVNSGADVIKEADKDKDGKLNEKEALDYLVKTTNIKWADGTLKLEIKSIDKNHDGYVTAEEIDFPASASPSKPSIAKNAREIIQQNDKNHDGKLDYAEARQFFATGLPYRLSAEAIENEIKALDKNHDGYLVADEIDPPQATTPKPSKP
ncbi:16 kDa calcium-binding protein-like [Planococcus citri]|uniref:16 kDa calcium-binding protein-like n=1 Tax=Planococcus citri TaxID=170843 RepID=UPI0031F730F3